VEVTNMGFLDKILGKEKKPATPARGFEGVKSGAESTLRRDVPTAPAPVPPPVAPAARTYEVKSGDSLSKIAQKHYGNGNLWRKIYEANRDQIKDPDLIHPGQKLIIP
jgi:nucleoid-associated protein YgaU